MNSQFTKYDIEKNKLKAATGYLVFFLPLILCRDSKLGRHCANQGLLLLITSVLLSILIGIVGELPLLGLLAWLAGKLVRFVMLLVGLMCFLQLTTFERAVELPYIGKFRIIQ